MKVVALDFGFARTGVAVSDPTGMLARPVGVVEKAGTEAGLQKVVAAIREHEGQHADRDDAAHPDPAARRARPQRRLDCHSR